MNLGFDLDGVVVDLFTQLFSYMKEELGIKNVISCFNDYRFDCCNFYNDSKLNGKTIEAITHIVNDQDFQFRAKPIPYACEVLSNLKKAGHKIHFITSRPIQNQPITFKWLRENNISFDSLDVIGHEDKGIYGFKHNLDMYIDDDPRHLFSMLDYKKRWKRGLLLYENDLNSKLISNNKLFVDFNKFKRVKSWVEIVRHVGVHNR